MTEQVIPVLPRKSLIQLIAVACMLAAVTLVVLVLPAEYNVDPLGLGETLGLSSVTENDSSNMKMDDPSEGKYEYRTDEVRIVVPAGGGVEYKFKLEQYQKLNFEWVADGANLYYDFHGEPEGDTTGFFESYAISVGNNAQGTATVPFSGVHGWYWENSSGVPVSVLLKTKGAYEVKGLIR